MQKKYTRKLSSTERIYLINGEMNPPFANQFFFEGTGAFNIKEWEAAVSEASEANPGSRLALRGFLSGCRWVDSGLTPAVVEADGSSWSGMDLDDAPFLQKQLSTTNGRSSEVLLLHGETLRVFFRTHHAIMDGRGTFTWIEDIFRVLNGKKPRGSSSSITEQELARSYQKQGRTPPRHQFISPTGRAAQGVTGICWRRYKTKGPIKNLLPKVAVLLACEAWRHSPGPVRFAIPVDLRFRQEKLRSTGNLTNLIYFDVTEQTTYEDLVKNMEEQIANKNDGMLYWADEVVRFVPLAMVRKSLRNEVRKKHDMGLYRNTAILSNMGLIDLRYFCGGGFNATAFCGIPPAVEYLPFFMGLAGYNDTVELVVSMPRALATDGRLEKAMEGIIGELHSFSS